MSDHGYPCLGLRLVFYFPITLIVTVKSETLSKVGLHAKRALILQIYPYCPYLALLAGPLRVY